MLEAGALVAARIRAAGSTAAAGGLSEVERVAAGIGRRVVNVAGRWVLAPDAAVAIDPRSTGITVRQLSQVPLVTLGAVISLCWADRSGPLYPGSPTTVQEVLRVVHQLGAKTKESLYHVKAALSHELPESKLILRVDDRIRLGTVFATWLPTEVENLRRSMFLLPSGDQNDG